MSLTPDEMERCEARALPGPALVVAACSACKLHRYARLAPACARHVGDLLEALVDWEGTPQEFDHALNVAIWPNMKGDPEA